MKKIYLSWEEVGLMIKKLAEKIKQSDCKFDGIYGIPRGGLPIGVALSNKLKLPVLMYPTANSLVVDDRSHTGKTLAGMKNRKIATLFNTEGTTVEPNWFVEYAKYEDWIVFPWEEE